VQLLILVNETPAPKGTESAKYENARIILQEEKECLAGPMYGRSNSSQNSIDQAHPL
jgi:hypothetical protein